MTKPDAEKVAKVATGRPWLISTGILLFILCLCLAAWPQIVGLSQSLTQAGKLTGVKADIRLEELRRSYEKAMADGRISVAMDVLDEALTIKRDPNLLRLKAKLNFRKGKRSEGFANLTEALSLSPGDVEVLKDRAAAYCQDQAYSLALSDYEQLAGSKNVAVKSSGVAGKALVNCAQGKFPQAQSLAREALSISPECAKAHEVLGNCLQKDGDLNGAVGAYTASLRLDRSVPEVYSNRALCYLGLGMKELSLADMEALVRLVPDDDRYRYQLGLVAAGMGRKEQARESLKEALNLNSGNRQAKKLLDTLQ